jgi:hypothetical protein
MRYNFTSLHTEIIRTQQHLNELYALEESYPKPGMLIKHKTEDTDYYELTASKWASIERYNDWGYYDVIHSPVY